jgi:hypothetical protein
MRPNQRFYLVEPTGIDGSVVDVVSRSLRQPGSNLGMLVGAVLVRDQVVVRDQMDVEPCRHVLVEVVKKRERFLVAMARFALRNQAAIEDVERNLSTEVRH